MGDFLLVITELFLLGAFVLSQFTRLTDGQRDRQTDRQTDGRADRRSSERPRCIKCSAVKTAAIGADAVARSSVSISSLRSHQSSHKIYTQPPLTYDM